MQLTTDSSSYIGQQATGYMVNSDLPPDSREEVSELQEQLVLALGDAIWLQPVETLHITLLDWIAPLVDYHKDKDKIFNEVRKDYTDALLSAFRGIHSLRLRFNQLNLSSNAIFCESDDASTLNKIREDFVSKIRFLPGTKQPPTIAHFTVARFVAETSLDEARSAVKNLKIKVPVTISGFRLVRETSLPMLSFEIIQEFPLNPSVS